MKKIIALLLVVSVLMLTLAACDNKNSENGDGPDKPTQTDPTQPNDPTPPSPPENNDDIDTDGVDDEYMPDDGWTNS